uniref:Tf2-1-like SH3-like domain-containing protein n=1 Tax=Triticum urartu TaxID=4572 RepID=A0A8R7UTT8_TRIUA
MKQQTNRKRSERRLEVGDMVFLKLQPYVQTSVAKRANHKLSFRFYGRFPVISKINEVAYKLELPPQATIHPVFHVSMLRRAVLPGSGALVGSNQDRRHLGRQERAASSFSSG